MRFSNGNIALDELVYKFAFWNRIVKSVQLTQRPYTLQNSQGASMIDILIKNATVYDGLGSAPMRANIAVNNGKIVDIGGPDQPAEQVIDASGLCAAPGFIDVHGHSDLFAFADPLRESKLCQGITTEIVGQCGLGPAPVGKDTYQVYERYFKGQGAPIYPNSREFTSFGAYLSHMDALATGINLAYFIPHGTVRMAVMGLSPAKPTPDQLHQMQELVRDGMENGAIGLSSGLMYAPGMFADSDELEALCKVVGEYHGIYTSHIRNQGECLEDSVKETIRIAKNGHARANISHHKASGKQNWGKVVSTIRMIHEADIPVMHDVYPYTASATMLRATLPPNVQKLEPEMILTHLKDKNNLEQLKEAIFSPTSDFESDLNACGYDGILIFDVAKTKNVIGKTIAQYADELGIAPFDAYIRLLIDNSLSAAYIGFSMCKKDVETLIADPFCMFGTDALYVPGMPMTHPRAIGTFPRILGRYVREKGILTLEEALRKMTSLPAQFYNLSDKGQLAVGLDADITIFDADTVVDHANYNSPLLANEGIHTVIVNGVQAITNGKCLGTRNGQVVRGAKS